MASMATLTAVQPTSSVKGLAGSSITGTKLNVRSSRLNLKQSKSRAGAVVAKYGDKSVYFDLEDLGNTTGQWDLYGSDAPSPYNSLQEVTGSTVDPSGPALPQTPCKALSKFFETFAAPFTKRGLLLKFLILGGGSTLAYFSSTASGDILPIKKGPQLPPKLGPRGKI
ncbi:hypothetical protein H5410_033371 [Solanum commersonii]|uniref:Photosystem I reaction center subunit VI n=1 Tax=Solanum commersonii TaxID=4109 RepID=A0A9J5YNI8_SOLCO|nr:hypothetical protein H5410_033371 [Solanum commersonii]